MDRLRFIDSHVHLYDSSLFEYPWLSDRPDLLPSRDAAEFADAVGTDLVDSFVLVEVDCRPDLAASEATWAGRFIHGSPPMLGMVAAVRLEDDDAPDHIDRLVELGHVCGVRRLLDTTHDDITSRPSFSRALDHLGRHDLPFDICVASTQLDVAYRLLADHAETGFVLDHLGKPDIARGEWATWTRGLAALAQCENLVGVKLSGLISQGAPGTDETAIRPYIDFAIDTVGPDRLMFGSDWPVLTNRSTWQTWFDQVNSAMRPLTSSERESIASGTARRVYGRVRR